MSAAVSRARAGTSDDAILGALPKSVVSPATIEEAASVLAEAGREKSRVAFVGGGTALALGGAPRGLDVVVRTTGLDRIIEHAPSDQVVTVEGGISLAALQRAASAHGQRLACDAPLAEKATLGGLLATNGFGPLRTRSGTLRDLVLGVTLVRADGTVARGGGKVVKNVAGFDLPKMAVGSLGTLGLIASATFRLHPLPERTVTLLAPRRSPKDVRAFSLSLREAQLEPAAVVALGGDGGKFDLGIRFEGFGAGVKEQVERTLALAAKNAASCDILEDGVAGAFWARHDAARIAGPLRAKVALLPSAFEEFFERSAGALRRLLDAPAVVLYPTLGISFFSGSPSPDLGAEGAAAAIASARSSLSAGGGSLVLEEAPAGVRALVDVWGPAPPSFDLMRRLKDRLDPDGLLNPGRFVGGL